MTIEDLLDECKYTYWDGDYKKLIGLCDEVFKKDSDNQIAISYKQFPIALFAWLKKDSKYYKVNIILISICLVLILI